MIVSKIEKVENKILVLAIFALAISVTQTTVLADTNNATQEASSNKIETIAIKNQAGATEITTITFPAGNPDALVNAPYNNEDGVGNAQVFHASTSKPVAQLVSATTYNLYVSVTDTSEWSNTVDDENIFCSNEDATVEYTDFTTGMDTITVWDTVTDMGTQTVSTSYKYLYMTINLGSAAGKTATSTLEVYGETP